METKIIFTGPVGAGKTTAINAISDVRTVGTEARASDEVALRKQNTTVAMDYGVLGMEGGEKVHLYGTPGQERFEFMWEILSAGAIGFVILLDSLREDPLADLQHYLGAFRSAIAKCNGTVVIGLTRSENTPHARLREKVCAELSAASLAAPVFEVDGRVREDVKGLMMALISLLDPSTSRGSRH